MEGTSLFNVLVVFSGEGIDRSLPWIVASLLNVRVLCLMSLCV